MRNKNQLWGLVWSVVFVLVNIAVFVLNLTLFSPFHYAFPKVLSGGALLLCFLLYLAVPATFAGVGVYIALKKEKSLCILGFFGQLLCYGLLLLVMLPLHLLYQPCFSFTDDNKDFGLYDEQMRAVTNYPMKEIGYPVEVPSSASDIQHFYWYLSSSAEYYGLMDAWTFGDTDEFDKEIARLNQHGWNLTPAETVYRRVPDYSSDMSEILIDWDKQTIAFFYVRDLESWFLPASVDEYASTDYTMELILQAEPESVSR